MYLLKEGKQNKCLSLLYKTISIKLMGKLFLDFNRETSNAKSIESSTCKEKISERLDFSKTCTISHLHNLAVQRLHPGLSSRNKIARPRLALISENQT